MNDLELLKTSAYQQGFYKQAGTLRAFWLPRFLNFGDGVRRLNALQTIGRTIQNIPRAVMPGRSLRAAQNQIGEAIARSSHFGPKMTPMQTLGQMSSNARKALKEFERLKGVGAGYDPRLLKGIQQSGMVAPKGVKTTTGQAAQAVGKSKGMTNPQVANPYLTDEAAILAKGGIPKVDHAFEAHMGRLHAARVAASEAAKREAQLSNAVFSGGKSALRPAGMGGLTSGRGITSSGGLTYL